MANYPQKIKMKVAQQAASKKFNLSHVHVTTASAMRPIVAAVRDTIPNENGSLAVKPFVKLNPLNVPVFGECNMHLRYFQVPIRVVAPQFNDFINDTTHVTPSGEFVIPTELPYFDASTLMKVFVTSDYSTIVSVEQAHDFVNSDASVAYRFTSQGSHAWQLLCSLGYNVPFNAPDTAHFSAVRLLAWAKVYSDWYYNSQYADTSLDIFTVRAIFAKDDLSAYRLSEADLTAIFAMCEYVNYDADYFTSVWDKPYSPNQNNSSSFVFDDYQSPAGQTTAHYYPNEWVPLVTSNVTDNNQVHFSQYMVDSLKALTDYLKRNQMSGTYSIDRYLARFGALLSAEKLNRSRLCGQENVPVKIGEVVSTADTETASLGSFAGKGIISSDGKLVQYTSDEFTIVLVIATIVPRHFYFQGLDRNILHKEKADYFMPEFDNLGVQQVCKAELLVDQNTPIFNDGDVLDYAFGYAPRYAEYKRGRDVVSGQFMNLSTAEQLRAWFFGRYLNPSDYTLSSLVHSPDFVSAKDAEQYERIFQYADTDNYNIIFTNDWTAQIQALPLFDTYEFDSRGDDIVMDTNGVKQN